MSPSADSSAGIRFRDVSFSFAPGRPVLDNLNLSVEPGETLVLLGRSGSGKTTTMKLINRLREPTSGSVLVEGKATTDWDPIRLRRHIGYVIQEVGLFPHFSVSENVALVPSLEGWDPDRIWARVREMLDLVGLAPDDFGSRYPSQLSGGQRQRVGVARALAADPSVLLLDEPFGALDPITRSEIRKEFRSLQRRLGKTTVFVTHDVAEAFALADQIGLMTNGKLTALVSPDEFSELDDPEARKFMESLT
jgi:osmoprotectant transport system ATP-binding protein